MNQGFSSQRHKGLLRHRRESAVVDTQIKASKDSWVFRNSHIENMHLTFKRVLPKGEQSLRGYLKRILEHRKKKGGAVGIEFGGPGDQVFYPIGDNLFKKTAGVTLIQSDAIKYIPKELREYSTQEYDDKNHEIIIGDILDPHTYDRIRTWLRGDKADVIIERLLAGFKVNPEEHYLVAKTFERWYEMLAEEGVMFVQVPWWAHDVVYKWVSQVQSKYGGSRWRLIKPVLEVQYSYMNDEHKRQSSDGDSQRASVMRLRKLKGAPLKLPQLVQ